MRRLARLAVLAALVVAIPVWMAIPAQASKTCPQHHKAFDVKGVVVSGTLSHTGKKKNTYDGTLSVTVTHTNKASRSFKNPPQPRTFTFTHARVSFEHGVSHTAPAAGTLVHLQGKLTCTGAGYAIHKVELKKPHPPKK